MTIETYEEMIKNIPPHNSLEFLDFLRENNVVRHENSVWLIIENIKYHQKDKQWWTAFYKYDINLEGDFANNECIGHLFRDFVPRGWILKENKKEEQSIGRYHLHIVEHAQSIVDLEKMVAEWKKTV